MLHRLGKIVFLFLFILRLDASVEIICDDYYMEGEAIRFQLVAKGFDVIIPDITHIDGYLVENIKSSEEAVLINSRKANKVTKTYELFAKRDLTIPSFKITIDKRIERSKVKHIRLKKISKTRSENFDLQMSLNKSKVFLGEELLLKLLFRYKDLEDYELPEPRFADIEVKEIASKEWKEIGGNQIEELTYRLKPQEHGNLTLPALKAKVEILKEGYKQLNNRSRYIQTIPVYSNALSLMVHALPDEISLIGDYTLSAHINKDKVKVGEAIILKVSIRGEGNIDNLDAIKLQIPDVTVYEKKSTKEEQTQLLTKTFEIISDRDFTIPSFTLAYLNQNTRTKKVLRSKAFNIKVINSMSHTKKSTLHDKHEIKKEKLTPMEKLLFISIGSLGTLVLVILHKTWEKYKNKKRETPFIRRIQATGDHNSLFKKMVPHLGKDRALDRLIYHLEEDNPSNFKKIKKEILLRLKSLSI